MGKALSRLADLSGAASSSLDVLNRTGRGSRLLKGVTSGWGGGGGTRIRLVNDSRSRGKVSTGKIPPSSVTGRIRATLRMRKLKEGQDDR